MNPIRILIADDHGLVRQGLRQLLQQLAGVEVVAEASNGYEAVELAARHQPQVVLMDIAMSQMNGLEATRRIAAESQGVRVLMLSMHADDAYVRQALAAGASGYVLKSAGVEELERAIRAIAQGQGYLTPAVAAPIIADTAKGGVPSPIPEVERLSPRQREVLQLIAEGSSSKEIAAKLNLSTKTVDTHRTELMKRLGIHDVAGLVRYAIRHGLVSPEA